MRHRRFVAVACMGLVLALCAFIPHGAFAQGRNDPANVQKLLRVLEKNGFAWRQGKFQVLDAVLNACENKIPSAWYNNVQPYMVAVLPGQANELDPWEISDRSLPVSYFLRQDEAIIVVGSTPPPMAYFSFQTFLFTRYNVNTCDYDKNSPAGFFQPYEAPFAYLGDTVNSLTIQTTGSTPYNRPMVIISTSNRTTQERLRAALRSAGYPDAIINTETLPSSLLRFGYEKADQFLFLMRTAIAVGGEAAIKEYQDKVTDPNLSPLAVFRVRPTNEFPSDPLPAPVLRTRGTGQTEIDLYPTMEKLRKAILAQYDTAFNAEELDTFLPDSIPEGYPAIQRGIAYLGPGQDGSAGYGRDANYWLSSWFDLPDDAFAIVYGVDHAATGKATYSSASVYLDQTLAAGVSSVDSSDFAANPHTASSYLPGAPGIEKFYVWKVARNCNGAPACMEAKVPAAKEACRDKIAANAPVRIGLRQYAEPPTRVGPTEAELLYDRVIVFRRK
jgi:hypothetical protein